MSEQGDGRGFPARAARLISKLERSTLSHGSFDRILKSSVFVRTGGMKAAWAMFVPLALNESTGSSCTLLLVGVTVPLGTRELSLSFSS